MTRLKPVLIYFVAISLMNLSVKAYAFRDVDRQAGDTAEEIIEAGMFETFIFKHGDSYFRPEGQVSRKDMLLVLGEYQRVMERLFNQNREILSKMENMEQTRITRADINSILNELRRELDSVVANSSAVQNLQEEIGLLSGGHRQDGQVPATADKIKEIEEEIADLKDKMEGPEAVTPSSRVAHDVYLSPLRLTIGLSAMALFFMSR